MLQTTASFLARPQFKADPFPFYARARRESPVFTFTIPFYRKGWLVTRYHDAVALLKDDRLSKDLAASLPWLPRFARPLTRQVLNRDPPDHTRLRRLVGLAFSPRRVEQLRGRMQAVCDELLTTAARRGTFDLVKDYALPLPLTVVADLLGIPPADRPRFHRMASGSTALGSPSGLLDVPLALPHLWVLMRYFRRLFAERRGHPGDDLVSALVQAEEDGDRLSEDELLGMAVIILIAGYETTVNLIGSGAFALLQHPAQRERFVREPELAGSAIEELLRFTSPAEMSTPSITQEDIEIAGVTIPRGSFAAAVLGSANRDEAQFPAPDTLDLAREPNHHLAFGHGRHLCLGASLTRLEGQLALSTVFGRFPSLHLAVPESEIRFRKALALRGPAALPVRA